MRHDMHRVETIRIDAFAIVFTVCAVLFAAIFSGLVSSLGGDRSQLLAALQGSSRTHSSGNARAAFLQCPSSFIPIVLRAQPCQFFKQPVDSVAQRP